MSEYPSYPASSDPSPSGAAAQARPSTIEGAFWAFIASTVISLLGGILVFGNRDALADATRTSSQQSGSSLTEAQIDQLVTIGIVVALVIAVVIALLYLLFAFKLRAGRNWARIVLTVITALQLLSVLVGQSTWAGYVSVLAAVVGVVLSFMAPSNAYINASKTIRS
ncbi:hypothetical protein VA596_37840 [Amycolatopsis sp., V23-08]|uniref:Uncharacterized protein n=1 Tax=Amycolatopsis heterodermiae TaxID=3110235 RepID=A0ABU5RGE5_9PSEU|nr:hypothetical protein [Amycolatopsis sp., V23-08]MEA5365342.1 hypothetical protein [Amycolatopsis sp., V23-08]